MIMSFLTKLYENRENLVDIDEPKVNIEESKDDLSTTSLLTHTRILHHRELQPIDIVGLIKIETEEEVVNELQECKSKYETLTKNYKKWKEDGINVPPQYLVRSLFETEVCDKLLCIHASIKMKTIRKNYTNYLGIDIIKRLKERTLLTKDNDKITDSLWHFTNNVTGQSIHEANLSIHKQCDYYVDHLGRYSCNSKSNKICIQSENKTCE